MNNIQLKIEKSVATVYLKQFNILDKEQREVCKQALEKILNTPAIKVVILLFQNAEQKPKGLFEYSFALKGQKGQESSQPQVQGSSQLQMQEGQPQGQNNSQNPKTNGTNPLQSAKKFYGKESWEAFLDETHSLFHSIEKSNKSWIVALCGPCENHTLELALLADYRIADFSNSTCFGFSDISLGLTPFLGASIRLPRLIGIKGALEILIEGKKLSPSKALKVG